MSPRAHASTHAGGSRISTVTPWPTARGGSTLDMCSSVATGCRSTRTTPPPASAKLVHRAGPPPVRLHDLRRGAASLAHEARADLKALQGLLGHSSIVVAADTYTSVLPQTQRRCADDTARLVYVGAPARESRPRPARADLTATAKQALPPPSRPIRRRSSRSRVDGAA